MASQITMIRSFPKTTTPLLYKNYYGPVTIQVKLLNLVSLCILEGQNILTNMVKKLLCLACCLLLASSEIKGDTQTINSVLSARNNKTNCYTVEMKTGSQTYCNITNMWKPSVKKSHALAAGFTIGIAALVFIIYGFKKAGSTLRGLCCTCQHNTGCFTLCNFVLAAALRILWKVIDVAIDAMTYYRLGKCQASVPNSE